ncbi:carbonic anhydrase 2-like [Cylas formicarius]|uniref:carbonic anhydrase 2-like n=1 Tax=Cylas formicarius TaxID=197179 RepID=UPI002958BC3F|nr:carbonic anhydrase 2-like [Cylas formicarius]
MSTMSDEQCNATLAEREEFSKAMSDVPLIWDLLNTEQVFESPIDINLSQTTPLDLPPLKWENFGIPPRKMKVTNTGHTVILSAKWGQERPYLTDGPLVGKYVFSQLHLHWGTNDMEGSEHTVDGGHLPGEMHVVTFKSCYLTQESALKEKDGIVILVYMLKLQEKPNVVFQRLVEALKDVTQAHTSKKIEPFALSYLVREFVVDYFTYCGSVSTDDCIHYVMWLITRVPIGVSSTQVNSLRNLMDGEGKLIQRNFRATQPAMDRPVLHVCPSTSKYSTLLPVPKPDSTTSREDVIKIYSVERFYIQSNDE